MAAVKVHDTISQTPPLNGRTKNLIKNKPQHRKECNFFFLNSRSTLFSLGKLIHDSLLFTCSTRLRATSALIIKKNKKKTWLLNKQTNKKPHNKFRTRVTWLISFLTVPVESSCRDRCSPRCGSARFLLSSSLHFSRYFACFSLDIWFDNNGEFPPHAERLNTE